MKEIQLLELLLRHTKQNIDIRSAVPERLTYGHLQETILFQNLNKKQHIISSCKCILENKAKFKTALLLLYQDKGVKYVNI